jgi:uncharacterized protein YggE
MKTIPTLASLLALANFAAAQPSPPPPSVTVQGRGEVRVPNTVAVVQLGFEAAGPEEALIREDITRRSQAVVAALKEAKAGRLQTTGISIRPEFNRPQAEAGKKPPAPKIIGYSGQIMVSFSTPVEDAGRIISAMMNLGANAVSNMFTEPSEDARRAGENEALTLAAKDAEAQARALLSALNLQWAGLRSVDATGGRFEPRPMARMMAMAADAGPLPELDIQGGETVITREVLMQVEFRGP